jgi:hypothetical protein
MAKLKWLNSITGLIYLFNTFIGTHFRNSTIAHYFFEELANEQIPIVVNLNFFVEKV